MEYCIGKRSQFLGRVLLGKSQIRVSQVDDKLKNLVRTSDVFEWSHSIEVNQPASRTASAREGVIRVNRGSHDRGTVALALIGPDTTRFTTTEAPKSAAWCPTPHLLITLVKRSD